jgi:hypothetical protein
MTFQMKPLGCDPARIKGMSERLIVSHYENNYGGAVKRLNLIQEKLAELDYSKAAGFLINGLKYIDFGAKAATYVDTFMEAIRWNNADGLLSKLPEIRGV